MKLQQTIDQLKEALCTCEKFNDALNECFNDFAESLSKCSLEIVEDTLLDLLTLIETLEPQKAQNTSLICGNLVEHNFPASKASEYLIEYYGKLVDTAFPFFDYFLKQVNVLDHEDDDIENKVSDLYESLYNELTDDETKVSIEKLTKLYNCAVTLFSKNASIFHQAKERFGEKAKLIGEYNNGCFWLAKLFSTLFDEPIVVIDIDHKKGFVGTMSGVNDNYQLQHLLMSMPEMNDNISLTKEQIDTVHGHGTQILDSTIVSKWNMYNAHLFNMPDWQELINTNTPQQSLIYQEAWIWSEGTPADIPIYRGCRLILLGKSPIQRSTRAQRTFSQLEARVDIKQILTNKEINEWLRLD